MWWLSTQDFLPTVFRRSCLSFSIICRVCSLGRQCRCSLGRKCQLEAMLRPEERQVMRFMNFAAILTTAVRHSVGRSRAVILHELGCRDI